MGPADELSCDAITAGFRIWQRRAGHRYSLDDLATAWEAVQVRPAAAEVMDLGCGIGSVLLMVAWKLPSARILGIEAQEASAQLAERSIAENRIGERAVILRGDLRELTQRWSGPRCDLVTGTPPYLPPGTALPSPDPQRAAARLELRGGIEDYLAAAARVLAPGGRVVVCADGRHPERALAGARAAGLSALRCRKVYARAGARAPLFSVWTLAGPNDQGLGDAGSLEELCLCMRDEAGERTEEAHALRRLFGL